MAIEHVVVLCLENRSFDHMLGYLRHPDPDFEGLLKGGPYTNRAPGGAGPIPTSPDAKVVLPVGPDHSHDAVMTQLGVTTDATGRHCDNQGFVESYVHKAEGNGPDPEVGILPWLRGILHRGETPKPAVGAGLGPLVMRCMDPARIPVLSRLALDFAVFDHWYCSVPGETWPNRNFLHAATSDGETNIEIRFYKNRTIFEILEQAGRTWRIYHDDTPQVWAFSKLWDTPERHANWFGSGEFAQHVADGKLATYSFIEPNHRPPLHTLDHAAWLGGLPDSSDSQHPENNLVSAEGYETFDDRSLDTDFDRGERLIATIYEALRANPEVFAKTLFLITYDEHGGLYDHVPPPTDAAPPGGRRSLGAWFTRALEHHRASRFDFRMLGPRVPAVLVSPLVQPGTMVKERYEHASVPATLRHLYAPHVPPLNPRDAQARSFDSLAFLENPRTDLPDLSAHLAPSAPTTVAPAAPAEPASQATPAVPEYYREFIAQADRVQRRLRRRREPELASLGRHGDDVARAATVTAAFRRAATRHRTEA